MGYIFSMSECNGVELTFETDQTMHNHGENKWGTSDYSVVDIY